MNASARADGSLVGRWWLTVDRWVLAALLTLLAVGAVMAFAASPAVAERLNYDRLHFVHRQLMLIPPAVIVMLAVSLLSPRGVARLGAGLFVLGLALTALTLYSGVEVKGARRWLDLGPLAFSRRNYSSPASPSSPRRCWRRGAKPWRRCFLRPPSSFSPCNPISAWPSPWPRCGSGNMCYRGCLCSG